MESNGTLIAALLVGLLVRPLVSAAQQEPEIIFAGQYVRGDLVRLVPGSDWLAVLDGPDGWVLAPTTVTTEPAPDACAGPAVRIKASGADASLFLVRGIQGLAPGPLRTGFVGRRLLYPGESMTVMLGDRNAFVFQAFGTATRRPSGEVLITGYELILKRYQQFQVLASLARIALDSHVQVVWAGDLDRDDQLDALLDLSPSYASHQYVLFLSSVATGDGLVSEAAARAIAGC